MSHYAESLNEHYAPTDISARMLEGLRSAGKDLERLTRDDLAPFDEFHGGGRESTRALARLAALAPGMQLLDLGSGVGGRRAPSQPSSAAESLASTSRPSIAGLQRCSRPRWEWPHRCSSNAETRSTCRSATMHSMWFGRRTP